MASTARARRRAPAPEELARIFYLAEHRDWLKKVQGSAVGLLAGVNDLCWATWAYATNMQLAADEGAQTIGDFLAMPTATRHRYKISPKHVLGNEHTDRAVLEIVLKSLPGGALEMLSTETALLKLANLQSFVDLLIATLDNALPRLETLAKQTASLKTVKGKALHASLDFLAEEIAINRTCASRHALYEKRFEKITSRLGAH